MAVGLLVVVRDKAECHRVGAVIRGEAHVEFEVDERSECGVGGLLKSAVEEMPHSLRGDDTAPEDGQQHEVANARSIAGWTGVLQQDAAEVDANPRGLPLDIETLRRRGTLEVVARAHEHAEKLLDHLPLLAGWVARFRRWAVHQLVGPSEPDGGKGEWSSSLRLPAPPG